MSNLLPHEMFWLKEKVIEGEQVNRQAAEDMTNAIENGNTWHDNAEYDEVRDRMKLIDAMYGPLNGLFSRAVEIEYPEIENKTISIGSLVVIEQHNLASSVLIAGNLILGEAGYKEYWREKSEEDLLIATTESPLGSALIGKSVGDTAEWTVKKRSVSALVVDVDNEWIIHFKKNI